MEKKIVFFITIVWEVKIFDFTDLLTRVSILSKQNNQKSDSEPEVRKRQNVTKEGTQTQTNGDFTKDQLEHVKR